MRDGGYVGMPPSSVLRAFGALAFAFVIVLAIPLASGQSQGRFVPPHSDAGVDTDGDTLFNILQVGVHVDASVGGNFFLIAGLYDATNTTEITSQYLFAPIAGPATVVVNFTGFEIQNSGIDGPYKVNLQLLDDAFLLDDVDQHTTRAYAHTDFDAAPAAFLPPHADAGEDRDIPPDGQYNALRVDVRVNVTEPGTFGVMGMLWDSSHFTMIAYDLRFVDLASGVQTVPLYLAGVAIRGAGVDGPYSVDLTLQGSLPGEFFPTTLDVGSHATAAYRWTDFQAPSATVQGTVREASLGFPLAGVTVDAYNYRDRVYLTAQTGPSGTYAMGLYPGDWIFTYEEWTRQSELRRATVTGSMTLPDARLSPLAPSPVVFRHAFDPWNAEDARMQIVGESDNATFRLTYDWQFGDRDAFLTQEEWNRSMAMFGGMLAPPADSRDLFRVDGAAYATVPGSQVIAFANAEGPVDTPGPPTIYQNVSFDATLPPAPSRSLALNVTYDSEYLGMLYEVQLPPLYALASFTSAPAISVTDLSGGRVAVDPGIAPDPMTYYAWITLVANATDTSLPVISDLAAIPNPVELGQATSLRANVTDDHGVDSAKVEIRDPGGAVVGNFTMTHATGSEYRYSHTPTAPGTYAYGVTAIDVVGNAAVATGTFIARDTTLPTADAGSDQTVDQHSVATFDGSGSTDNDRVANYTWTFTDNGARTLYGANPTYRFDRAGTFTVTLVLRDPSGNSASDAMQVTVTPTTGTIQGSVRDDAGTPLSGATVRLLSGSTEVATATTNATGGFSFPDATPGTYTVRVELAGFDAKEESVTVAAGGIATRDVILTRPSQIPGWVLPTALIAVLAVVALGGAAYGLRRRKRTREVRDKPAGPGDKA